MPASVVLDTSAIVAWLEDEPGADQVEALLRRAARSQTTVYVAFISLMEAQYIMIRRAGDENAAAAISFVENWPLEIVDSDREWGREAAAVKARGGLSLADAWIAALAMRLDADLVHKDKEFDSVPGLRSVRL